MAIREIINEKEDVMKKTSRPVDKFDSRLAILLDDMVETMHQADGVGLAAVQVGVLRRVVVIDVGEGVLELINPEIIEQSGEQEDIEGCLSCPGKYGITKRPMKVTVRA
ncbi:MAG: peptide deformylase, partial [Clostridiales bacterium]|nr:peptide deformylase [Clostridiales bacterium]